MLDLFYVINTVMHLMHIFHLETLLIRKQQAASLATRKQKIISRKFKGIKSKPLI